MAIEEIGNKDPLEKLRATGQRVIVRDTSDELEGKTASGIYIPDSAEKREFNAVVITAGPDVDERIKKGTRVIFDSRGAIVMMPNTDDKILCVPTGNILAFWE